MCLSGVSVLLQEGAEEPHANDFTACIRPKMPLPVAIDRAQRIAVIPRRVPEKKRKEKVGVAAEYPRPFVKDTAAGNRAPTRYAVKYSRSGNHL